METLIFYPGGLVDPHSYLKWQDALVSQNPYLRVVTVKMPSNLAVLGTNKGARLFEMFDETQKWYVAGHSLGGAIATNFVAEYKDNINALIYLAAYPTDDRLSNFSGGVLSIYAEYDGLVAQSEIDDRISDLPEPIYIDSISQLPNELNNKTVYYKILGGNHAQFGNYGAQDGDKEATISTEKQQEILVQLITAYLNKLP